MADRKSNDVKRHRFWFSFFGGLVKPILHIKFRFSSQPVEPQFSPYILLANHTTDWDPVFIASSLKDHVYFVASEHVMRLGSFLSGAIKYIFNPIIRVKGMTESRCAMEILKTLRRGSSVGIFAEGNRSYTGVTGAILPSTGKLVKRSGVGLITYRMIGGYLTSPRWSRRMRRGKITGNVVGQYSAEQLAGMTDDEVNELIARDLHVDAIAEQRTEPVAFKGKGIAEDIQVELYTCPRCGKLDTIDSGGDRFWCRECGARYRYSEYGYISSDDDNDVEFETVLDWDRWQAEKLRGRIEASKDGELFADSGLTLLEIKSASETEKVSDGRLAFFRDRMTFTDSVGNEIPFKFAEIGDLSVLGQMTLTFVTSDNRHYEIVSDHPYGAAKYREAFLILK